MTKPIAEIIRVAGTARRWMRARPGRTAAQLDRFVSSTPLSEAERAIVPKISSRISFRDGMYNGDGAHYFGVGLDALRRVEEAFVRAENLRPIRILDFPSGYGRVLRFLSARFPDAQITTAEIQPGALRFCAETFKARPVLTTSNFGSLSLGGEFDLIWCGSLVTHLNSESISELFRCFLRHLATGGVLVFSSHGDYVADRLAHGEQYGLAADQIPELVESYRMVGFGYLDYPKTPGYGVSLTAPAWIRKTIGTLGSLDEKCFFERGWDSHQDVFGFRRT